MFEKKEKFCCQSMRSMIYESLEKDMFTPINQLNSDYYSLSFRNIYFCPFCGSSIATKISASAPSWSSFFCCRRMERHCNIEDISDDFVEFGIFYDAFSRRYYFSTHKQWLNEEGVDYKQWDIFYCIFCGAKLPDSLLELWLDIVTKEFGAPRLERSEKMLPFVPEEYRTDAWWKKRGL